MSKRTTMVLGGIAVAMLAYILIFERNTLSTAELDARRGRVIETFVRAHVTRVEVEAGDTHVALQRAADQGEETLDTFGVGEWTLEAPVHADADGEAVDGLLSALEWLDARRTLEGTSAEDRARFGLDHPVATVTFTVAGTEHRLLVGGDDPRGEGIYVTVDEGSTSWIVGRDLLEALQHDADHFRNKEIFRHFRTRDARRVEITNADTHAVMERTSADGEVGPWQLVEPTHAYARAQGVDSLLQFATHARAMRFLREEASTEDEAATPARELRIERAPVEAGEGPEDRSPLRIRVLGACPGHEDEVVAILGEGPVICLLRSDTEPLDVELQRLRELRLVTTPDDRVDTITIAHGESSFTLRRHEGGFRIGEGDEAHDADANAVGELMQALRAQEAQEMTPVSDAVLAEHGLDAPSATITIGRTDEDRQEVVHVGRADAVGLWVRRGDEEQVARYDLSVQGLVASAPITFRQRELADRDVDDATEVRITRGTELETITHAEDGWHVTTPAELVADEAGVRDVARGVGSLTAVRFVADHASPEHGLDHPRYTVVVHFGAPEHDEHEDEHEADDDDAPEEGPVDLTVRVGASAEGGAYATFGDDPAVIVVSAGFVDAIERPLPSRDLMAIPTGDLSAITITSPNGTVALREEGAGWVTDLGPAASGPATAMLDRLASLHASGVEAYGTAMPASAITIETTSRTSGATPTRIEIGPVVAAEGAIPYRLARISTVPVVYRLQDADAQALADYRP